ncbi:MAG: autotransporter outer membrane beta-barrel domain-containing protein [Spirochaetaceae bacterium]|jgi:hypothetical protein|nr:autotransporter outer membrane beta-barrel domain-containing protein [Spirochaetaceae bacterium]
MKKAPAVAFFFAALARLSALDIDTGFGVNFGYNYSSIKMTDANSATYDQGYGVGGIGPFFFVDAVYVEGSLNFFFANTSLKHNETLGLYDGFSGDYNLNGMSIGLGILAKYPFYLGSLTLFPLLGFETHVYVSQTFSKDYEWDNASEGDTYGSPASWNSFWIRVGGGVDYYFSGALFIRGELIMDIKIPSALDKAYMENQKFLDAGFSDPQFFGLGISFRASMGIKISNLLGYPSTSRNIIPEPKKPSTKKPSAPKTPPKKKRDPNVYVPQD